MKTTILIDLNALPEDLEAQAVAMIDAMGAIEAAFVGRVLGELGKRSQPSRRKKPPPLRKKTAVWNTASGR
jgi:hypothetical protein